MERCFLCVLGNFTVDTGIKRCYNTSKMNCSIYELIGDAMKPSIELTRKIALAYGAVCKPLCRELELPQTAFDILLFLGNNPDCRTASEIVELRHIKANLVSAYVERLVQTGYLERRPIPGDRRKTGLFCTEQAQPVIARGQRLQNDFAERLFADMDEEMRRAFFGAIAVIGKNLDAILAEGL